MWRENSVAQCSLSRCAVLAVLFLLSSATGQLRPLAAQAPKICSCIEAADFGGCTIKVPVNYPGSFPGSAAMVAGDIGGKDVFYVYVADLFNGFTFRYDLKPTGGAIDSSVVPAVFISPEASRSETEKSSSRTSVPRIVCPDVVETMTSTCLRPVRGRVGKSRRC